MPEWLGYLDLLKQGTWITIQVTFLGSAVALVIAFIAGFARLSRSAAVRTISSIYIEFFRGTSVMVQLFWLFFVLPFFGIRLEPLTVGVAAVGLNIGSYGAEVVRAAILAVPKEQTEAAIALNLTEGQTMKRIILPQAIVAMLPPFGNLAIDLMKETSVLSLITIADLTFQAQVVRRATGETVIPFTIILIIYFMIATAIAWGISYLERRASRGLDVGKHASHQP